MVDKNDKKVGDFEGFIVKNVKKGLFSPTFDKFHVWGPSILYNDFVSEKSNKIIYFSLFPRLSSLWSE